MRELVLVALLGPAGGQDAVLADRRLREAEPARLAALAREPDRVDLAGPVRRHVLGGDRELHRAVVAAGSAA